MTEKSNKRNYKLIMLNIARYDYGQFIIEKIKCRPKKLKEKVKEKLKIMTIEYIVIDDNGEIVMRKK